MAQLPIDLVKGDVFTFKATNPRHLRLQGEAQPVGTKDFGSMLYDSLNEVNTLQQDYAKLTQQAIVNPDSVNPHDITIAGAEANLSLNIAKNVIDRVVRAYREITTLR